ncbi:unnamed protein product [Microthlaspi erraticum]|uniref:DUF3741 domain-containing protein n=1 Tax=Microthlaspi erraticum TaxID=1685480 RepID=A0A6D2IYI8_9BRAS|nr:unnamed protein product [Microthlaspi erraticum]
MKSSPSSSSSLSLGSKTHTFGCISLILQRFLCSGASSTYPSDQTTEPGFESPDFGFEPAKAREDGEPGAVARLMGLDSIPITNKTRVVSRSRSVNSADYVERDKDVIQGKHRRVKSSMDSHKLMEYVELQDDHFFILSFDKDRNAKGFGELKQLGTGKCKKRREAREDQTRIKAKENNINAMNVSPGRETEELKQRRKEKRKNRRKRRESKLRQSIQKEDFIKSCDRWSRDGDLANCEVKSTKEEESCDEDSSPVSVLDYDRFAGVRLTPESDNTSRRRLSTDLESTQRNETIQEDHNTWRESSVQHNGYQEMWLMICRLTVYEIEGTNWVYGKASKLKDLEGSISEDIVSNILDQLLEETIVTLSLTSQV